MDRIVSQRTIRRRAVAAAAREMALFLDVPEENVDQANATAYGENDTDQEHQIDQENDHMSVGTSDNELELENNIQHGMDIIFDSSDDEDDADENQDGENWVPIEMKDSLRQWVLESSTPLCHVSSLLKILRPYFQTLPKDARTLLKTPRSYDIEDLSGGQFYYRGVAEGLRNKLKNHQLESNEITLQINVDGLPLFKSTSENTWPILALVKEIDPEPFIIALWVGKSKPKDSNDILNRFVLEMTDILENGIQIDEKNFTVRISNFVCDAPARSFVKKTKGHSGYDGCDFCVQHGEYFKDRMTFPEHSAQPRTDIAFDEMQYVEGHQTGRSVGHQTGRSVLRKLDVGMVSKFPHDYMHLICLGVVKKLVLLWTNVPSSHVRLGGSVLSRISESIINVRSFLPREFARKGRPLSEVSRWKATEFRTFLLYVGPVVLRGKIPEALYNNFLMLSVGIRILSNAKYCRDQCDFVEELLKVWAQNVSDIYGKWAMIYNVHGVTHLASQCRLYGPLHNFCGFPFENFLQTIKKLVRKPNSPLQQIIRRLDERIDMIKHKNISGTFCKKQHHCGPVPDEVTYCEQYEQLQMSTYLFSSKPPDNAILVGKTNYIIRNILIINKTRKLVCEQAMGQKPFFEYPLNSEDIDITYFRETQERLCLINPKDVTAKVVLLPYDQGFVSLPMLDHI